jgi:small-conductance mechanosensitive channel
LDEFLYSELIFLTLPDISAISIFYIKNDILKLHIFSLMLYKFLLASLMGGILLASTPQSTRAQSFPSLPNVSQSVNNQGEVLRTKQEARAELQQRQIQLLKDIDALIIEIQELERQERELEGKITRLEETLTRAQGVDTESSDQGVAEQRDNTEESVKVELDQAKVDLIEVEKQLAQKKSTRDANRESLANVELQLQEVEAEVETERNKFIVSLTTTAREYSPYVGAIIFLLIAYDIAKRLNRRYASEALQNLISAFLKIALMLSVGLILLYMFVGQLGNIITLLSVFSAAMVVALQDFVSSFFAWIFIRARNKFKEGDVIKVASANGSHYFFGKVKKIEAFRTLLVEVVGDGDFNGNIDKERPTGRVVSVPNNTFLKQPIVNATQDNRTVWQAMDIVITFDSDWQKGKMILQEILTDIFTEDFMKEYKISKQFEPRVLTSIAGEGVRFSLWFPARVGEYREVLEVLSEEILVRFDKGNITLAYNTLTIEMKK